MDKAGLRARVREGRKRGHQVAAGYVATVLDAVPRGAVCCYVALPGEPPTDALIEALLARGDSVFLPVALPGGSLEWVSAHSARPWMAWGVPGQTAPPPNAVTLPAVAAVIVPAMAVTPDGLRLGQGGGYYDRFLPTVPGARTVALVWSDEVVNDVLAQPHDVRVDTWVVADG